MRPILTPAKAAGYTVAYRGRSFYDPNDPEGQANRMAAALTVRPDTLILVDSPLLGYGLAVLLDTMPAGCRILCVEQDQQLMALSLEHISPTILADDRCDLVRADAPEAVLRFAQEQGLQKCRRLLRVSLSGGSRLNSSFYRSVAEMLEVGIREYWQNRATAMRLGRRWVSNLIDNLGTIARRGGATPASPFSPLPSAGALLVGAGPSAEALLELDIEDLKGLSVIAVDTALPLLSRMGIAPDLVVIVESQWANMLDFVGVETKPRGLAIDLTAYPAALRTLDVPSMPFLSRFAPVALIDRVVRSGVPEVPALGSVGVVAAYHALQAGVRRVAAIGFDFAYSPGKPHARGCPTHRYHLATSRRSHPSPLYRIQPGSIRTAGKDGRPIATDLVLSSYAGLMGELAGRFELFVDAGATGLSIGGARRSSLAEALRLLGDPPSDTAVGRGTAMGGAVPGAGGGNVSAGTSGQGSFDTTALVTDEIARLKRAIETLESASPDKKVLEAVDYIWTDFAEGDRVEPGSPTVRGRLLSAATYYLSRWERSLSPPR